MPLTSDTTQTSSAESHVLLAYSNAYRTIACNVAVTFTITDTVVSNMQEMQLRLTHVEVEGFKSFRDKTIIGPLADFTCIVGPNGCGKSVVGEAIAFALGGNRKMLRAGSLASLLNQERRAAGCRTAQVTLRLEVLPTAELASPAPSRPATTSAEPCVLGDGCAQQHPTAAAATAPVAEAANSAGMFSPTSAKAGAQTTGNNHQQAPALTGHSGAAAGVDAVHQHTPQPWLGVRRTLRGDTTKTHIKRPGRDQWVPVSQAELQAELAAFNIHTQAVDRYIVTQSRQAVDVGDAVGLVKQLEFLTGTGDYEARIQQLGATVEAVVGSIDETQQCISSLECEREQLAPHVAHWQAVQQQQAQLLDSKVQLLHDQQAHGAQMLKRKQQQLGSAESAAAASSETLQEVSSKESQLQQQEEELAHTLLSNKQKEQGLKKKMSRLSAAAAASKVQLSDSASALKRQQGLAEKLQEKLTKLHADEAQHKLQVAEHHVQLRKLQEVQTEAEQQLAAAKEAVLKAREHAAQKSKHNARQHPTEAANSISKEVQQLQQQLSAADVTVAELQSVQSAAASTATHAAVTVQGLQASVLETEAALVTSNKQLEQAVAAVQHAAVDVETCRKEVLLAEQQWKDAHMQQREIQNQLQQAQLEHQHLQQHPSHVPPPSHASTAGSWPAYDSAIQQLKQQSGMQQLPGTFYGRLCNVISINNPSAAVAVNAALAEVANMNSTLVVSDRKTASAVIQHFRQDRVGTVQCKILSEVPAAAAMHNAAKNSSNHAHTSLLECVSAAPEFRGLLQQLVGSWLLVEDREAANKLLHLRRNLVTRIGEVFKADGEVVVNMCGGAGNCNNRNNTTQPYSLMVFQPAVIAAPCAAADAAAAREAAAAAARAAKQHLQELEQQAAAASRGAAGADMRLKSAREACLRQQQPLQAVKRQEQQLQQQQQGNEARAAQLRPQLQQQLASAEQARHGAEAELSAATAAVQHALTNKQELELQLKQHTEEAETQSTCKTSTADAGVPVILELALQQAAAELAEAVAAVSAAWAAADKSKQLQQRSSSKAAAMAKELARVQGTGAKQKEFEKLQANLESEEQQLASTEAQLKDVQAQRAELSSSLKAVHKQLVKANKEKAAAQREADTAQALLQQERAALKALQQQQEQHTITLQQLLKQQHKQQAQQPATHAVGQPIDIAMAGTAAGSADELCDVVMRDASQQQHQESRPPPAYEQDVEAVQRQMHAEEQLLDSSGPEDAPVRLRRQSKRAKSSTDNAPSRSTVWRQQHKKQGRRNTRTVVDDSTSGDSDSSGALGSSDTELDDSSRRSSRAAARGAKRDKLQDKQHGYDAEMSAAALAKLGQQLQLRQQLLDDLQHDLQRQLAKVNEAAVERDLQALQELAAAHAMLQQLEQQHNEAVTAREQLVDERYTRLMGVLRALNEKLDGVYRQLTGGCGSAYCAYTQERRLLFSQGVSLHVQPDGVAWRQFGMLSGGQQALATLALSFSLQALFPSPFYFFDEVDCALDSLAAGRVAAYVGAQCGKASSKAVDPIAAATATACITAADAGDLGNESSMLYGECNPAPRASKEPAAAVPAVQVQGNHRSASMSAICGAQYLLVSHRPVVFESASCLLGVYSNGRGSSAAVVAHF